VGRVAADYGVRSLASQCSEEYRWITIYVTEGEGVLSRELSKLRGVDAHGYLGKACQVGHRWPFQLVPGEVRDVFLAYVRLPDPPAFVLPDRQALLLVCADLLGERV
jgi:hypothetical protein